MQYCGAYILYYFINQSFWVSQATVFRIPFFLMCVIRAQNLAAKIVENAYNQG